MQVELVSAERRLWSGQAEMVVARTVEGEIGILPGHAPVVAELAIGRLRIIQAGGEEVVAAIHGGFMSVTADGVRVLADIAELADDIDLARAQAAYDQAVHSITSDDDVEAREARDRAAARLRARNAPVS
jgi:F-type H+-transporting ATPase subunit epsilon